MLLISESEFRRSGLPNRGFRTECIAKNEFAWISCLMNSGIDLCRFFEALGTVCFWGGLENRLENATISSDVEDPEPGIWVR